MDGNGLSGVSILARALEAPAQAFQRAFQPRAGSRIAELAGKRVDAPRLPARASASHIVISEEVRAAHPPADADPINYYRHCRQLNQSSCVRPNQPPLPYDNQRTLSPGPFMLLEN